MNSGYLNLLLPTLYLNVVKHFVFVIIFQISMETPKVEHLYDQHFKLFPQLSLLLNNIVKQT